MRIILSKKLLKYYDDNRRQLPWRDNPTPYRVWVSEIMLQQTRAAAVIPYYERFLKTLPNIEDLAKAEEDLLNKLWEGLGYYSRVRNMKKAAIEILSNYNGSMPNTYNELIKLPGIGPYTAGAIASIAFGEKVPAIDGNLLRIYSRLHCIDASIDLGKTKKDIFNLVLQDISETRPGDFNQALMDLGSGICLPKNPKCEVCPIQEYCLANKKNQQDLFPKRKEKTRKSKEKWTFLLIENKGEFLIHQRPSSGLLANLWQFPQLSSHFQREDIAKYLEENGFIAKNIVKLNDSQHIFSHKIWDMQAYFIELKHTIAKEEEIFYGPYKWASQEEIKNVYPFASAIAKYVQEVLLWNG